MYCSLSGVTPKEPVVSRTGYIFERRLIEEHIQRLGTCPVTKEPLSENDLTDIKGPQAARDGRFFLLSCVVASHTAVCSEPHRQASHGCGHQHPSNAADVPERV